MPYLGERNGELVSSLDIDYVGACVELSAKGKQTNHTRHIPFVGRSKTPNRSETRFHLLGGRSTTSNRTRILERCSLEPSSPGRTI